MNLQEKIFSYLSELEAVFTAATTGIITSAAHGLMNEDLLQFTTADTLPAGLELATDYYVRDVTTNTFKVSTIKGGPAVDITDTGTGVHTFHLKGRVIFTDGFEHIQLAIDTANNGNFTLKVQGSNSEDAPDFNAAQTAINSWDYIDIVDLEDKGSIDGDIGVSVAGTDDHRMFEINVNALRWTTIVITAWTAGNLDAKLKSNKSYN